MKEQDIRPLNLLEEYLKLSKQDAKVYKSKTNLKKAFCEACDNHKISSAFKKNGFMYKTCSSCQSLLLSPRPNPEKLNTFYRSSKSAAYWANTFFPSVAEIRRKKIFRPRIIKIKKICDQHNLNVKKITEIGSGSGIFLEEWVKKFPETRCTAIEPSRDMAEQCRKKGIHVFEGFVEQTKKCHIASADLVVCFEVGRVGCFEGVSQLVDGAAAGDDFYAVRELQYATVVYAIFAGDLSVRRVANAQAETWRDVVAFFELCFGGDVFLKRIALIDFFLGRR